MHGSWFVRSFGAAGLGHAGRRSLGLKAATEDPRKLNGGEGFEESQSLAATLASEGPPTTNSRSGTAKPPGAVVVPLVGLVVCRKGVLLLRPV